jgi:hypothetical protein
MGIAEVWQITTKEINKILSTEMDMLRRGVFGKCGCFW